MQHTEISEYWRELVRLYHAGEALLAAVRSGSATHPYRTRCDAVASEIDRVFHAAMRRGRMGRVEAQY